MEKKPVSISVLVYLPRPTSEVEGLIRTVHEGLEGERSYEIILLDDGTGRGKELIGPDSGAKAPLKIVDLGKRFGESVAVDAGLSMTTGDVVVTLPAVRPVAAEDIRILARGLRDGADLVIGYRTGKSKDLFEQARASAFSWITKKATGITFRDLSSGVRAFRREVAEEAGLYGEMIRFLPVLAAGRGYRVEEFPLAGRLAKRERSGEKREKRFVSPMVYLNHLLDLLTLFFLLRFTRKPLRFFGLLGAALLIPGIAIDLYLLVDRLVQGQALAGRPLLLLGILLTVLGVQTISIGLIGEMIIFTHSREIRDYSIREVLE